MPQMYTTLFMMLLFITMTFMLLMILNHMMKALNLGNQSSKSNSLNFKW